MTGRRQSDKWSRWILVSAIIFFIVFVFLALFGLRLMFNEIKEITKGQQELILNLTMKDQKANETVKEVDEIEKEKPVFEMEFNRYVVENERTINQLKQDIKKLQYQLKSLKRPL